MSAAALIGDQLILEEDYDENYIASEQEIFEYAREIGIDPDTEPDLLWLAREGIVAPLPPEWKPCQDVTGEIYYFNFSTGQSTWDHPCDEHYRRLVGQERERTQLTAAAGAPGDKKKEKKKTKKEKKEKKENKKKKEPLRTPGALSSSLGPLPSPLGSLAPLRGLDAPLQGPLSGSAPALRGSLSSSGGLEPLRTSSRGLRGSGALSVLGSRQEEKVLLDLPAFNDENNEDNVSENEPDSRGSDRPLKNLHFDLDDLGAGLKDEGSEGSDLVPPEERTEPELQDLAMSGDQSPELPSKQEPLKGGHMRLSPQASGGKHPPSAEPDDSEEIEEELHEVEEEKEAKGGAVKEGKEEKEGEQRGSGAAVEGEKGGASDEVEEDSWDGEKEGKVSGNVKHRNEEEGSDGGQKSDRRVESRDRKTTEESDEDDGNSTEEKEEVQMVEEDEDGSSEVAEKRFRSGQDGGKAEEEEDKTDDERDISEAGDTESEKKKVEVIRRGGQKKEEDEEGVSEEVLDRCSLSQRKLTESDEEALERCVKSEGEETEGEGVETEDGLRASESDDEAVEVFKRETPTAEPGLEPPRQTRAAPTDPMNSVNAKPLLRAEDSEASRELEETSFSVDVKLSKKVPEIKDLNGRIGQQEKSEEKEEVDTDTDERHVQAKSKDEPLVHEVSRLVLHQSSPSLSFSGSSHSEEIPLERGEPPGLQRPQSSRGRLVRTSNTQLDDAEVYVKNRETTILKDREKKEDGDRGEEEDEERLKRNTERELEGERERMQKEKERRIQILQDELRREEEQEERRLKEQSEERLRTLRQRLLSRRTEEEARLSRESDQKLEELKQSVKKEREEQQQQIREESKAILKELQVSVEEERAAARSQLEDEKRRDLERLKEESEGELQAERRRLQREREDQVNSIKQEARSTERRRELMMSPRPEHQLAEYHRELGEVLQEVREEVQRDHERKLEQLKDDHRREMSSIREKYLDEETAQREQMLSALKDDRERLQASHTLQLEKLRLQLDAQIQKTQLAHSRKESELKDLADQLELREKELKSQEALLLTKAADLRRRRQKLGEEEQEVDSQLEALPRLIHERDQLKEALREEKAQARELVQVAREERNEARGQERRLKEERDRAREENRRLKEENGRLQSKVALLQERCQRLSLRLSELDQEAGVKSSPRSERNKKKEQETAPPADHKEPLLHVDDLDEPPLSPVPDSHSSMDEFRPYISSHGATIQKTKLFLERESSRLQERQAALQAAAQSSSSQGPTHPGGMTQEMIRSLQQEARNVAELQQTVQTGNSLLRRQEEQLQQLESSMAEEPLFEDLSRHAGERKVTFDVTESDLSSAVDPPDAAGHHPTVPAKVQELAESLQQISSQLNTVLGALGSLAQGQGTVNHPTSASAPAIPNMHHLSASSLGPPPPPAARVSQPPWAWPPHSESSTAMPLFSTPISGGLRASDELINSRWSSIFPGASIDQATSSTQRSSPAYSLYTPISDHDSWSTKRSLQMDGQRLQGLIDGNKRWLEMRKKDTSIPLFTRYRAPSSKTGLVQLGLSDNNQIRVYHY
ncbi:centrosomal protein of 164 kDa isoform X1 [Salarias fasciatus]|uniref:Centrosomal protein of 164 kDa n=1 Tax=Salarias fasciatus TaxID=181472 RepID=A0A672IQY3_SALFA|nr:centrosomal protein of 164 kDa isoform X1 [Salarias fasciatus]